MFILLTEILHIQARIKCITEWTCVSTWL